MDEAASLEVSLCQSLISSMVTSWICIDFHDYYISTVRGRCLWSAMEDVIPCRRRCSNLLECVLLICSIFFCATWGTFRIHPIRARSGSSCLFILLSAWVCVCIIKLVIRCGLCIVWTLVMAIVFIPIVIVPLIIRWRSLLPLF